MSFRVRELVDWSTLGHVAKAVLSRMAFYAADDGSRVYPSWETLQLTTGLGRTAVSGAIKELIASGLLVVVSQRHGRATEYRIDLPALAKIQHPDRPRGELGPVRRANPTRPPDGLDPSAARTLSVREQSRIDQGQHSLPSIQPFAPRTRPAHKAPEQPAFGSPQYERQQIEIGAVPDKPKSED